MSEILFIIFQANNMGVGVVGIIECNFLKPTHNKQDFDYTNEYRYVTHLFADVLRKCVTEMVGIFTPPSL